MPDIKFDLWMQNFNFYKNILFSLLPLPHEHIKSTTEEKEEEKKTAPTFVMKINSFKRMY